MNTPSTPPQPYDASRLCELAHLLINHIHALAHAGWTPATSSNFSHRLDKHHAAITVSGIDKRCLSEEDIMVVDLDGNAVGLPRTPSAEMLLHTQLYRRFPEIGCVLHTHSLTQTVASRVYAGAGHICLKDYELLKAFEGHTTHKTTLDIPVFSNTQDMKILAAQVDTLLDKQRMWGYLIDGHGMYAWGKTITDARRHLEALEFLLHCELDLLKLRGHL
ncbi:MAG TPA: methylthioribulose 1-phosphate dehydratase [Xylella sp.]